MIPADAPAPPARDPFADADLTKLRGRPLQVVTLRLRGLSHREIAAELGIATRSVDVYVYFARRALGMADGRGAPLRTGRRYAPGAKRGRPPAPAPANDPREDDDQPTVALQIVRNPKPWQPANPSTLRSHHLSRDEIRAGALVVYPDDVERPRTRGDCAGGPRPCPFVSCAHHLYLDVNPENGSLKLNFPHLEVWDMAESCALDLADRGGITLDETGGAVGVTRERARQIEEQGVRKLRLAHGKALGIP